MFDWLRPRRSYLFFYYSLVVWTVPLFFSAATATCPILEPSTCILAHPSRSFVGPLVAAVICYPIAIGVTKIFPTERWSSNSRFLNRLFHPKSSDITALAIIALIFWLTVLLTSFWDMARDIAPYWIWRIVRQTYLILGQPFEALVLWYQEITSSRTFVHPIWGWVEIPFLGLWHFLLAWMIVAITGRLTR